MPLNASMRMIRNALLLSLLPLCALSFWMGYQTAPQGAVESFNDGWSDSKLDDCQQGFLGACEWLQRTK